MPVAPQGVKELLRYSRQGDDKRSRIMTSPVGIFMRKMATARLFAPRYACVLPYLEYNILAAQESSGLGLVGECDMEDFEREGRNAYMRAYRKTPNGKIAVAKAQKKCYKKHGPYPQDPQRAYELSLERLYGITMADYSEMFIAQGGRCAACGKEPPLRSGKPRRMCVDHNPATGEVRGLLCWKCNMALGNADDSAEILQKLHDYLVRSP